MYDEWTSNESYGAALGALHLDEIDFVCSTYVLTVDRMPYITLVAQSYQFRYKCHKLKAFAK